MVLNILRQLLLMVFLFVFPLSLWGVIKEGPLNIEIDPLLKAQISPKQSELLENIAQSLSELSHWEEYDVDLPQSSFESVLLQKDFSVKDFFTRPRAYDELKELSKTSEGKRVRLSAEQLKEIRDIGQFSIESKEYKGQKYVWKVAFWLQKGRRNIRISLEKDLVGVEESFIVFLPKDVNNFGQSFRSFFQGLKGIGRLIVGFPENDKLDLKPGRPVAFLQEKSKDLPEFTALVKKDLLDKFDDRLFDKNVQKNVRPYLQKIQEIASLEMETIVNEKRTRYRNELSYFELTPTEREKMVQSLLTLEEDVLFEKYLESDKELELAFPGYGKLLSHHRKALRIVQGVESALQRDIANHYLHFQESFKKKHALQAKSERIKEKVFHKEAKRYYRKIVWDYLETIPSLLHDEGLEQEAILYGAIISYHKEHIHIKGKTFTYDTDSVKSTHYGWRLVNAYYLSKWMAKNLNYHILVTNLLRGPIGLSSLFSTYDRLSSSHLSLKGHIKHNIEHILASREKFESADDEGFIAKRYTRVFHMLWNYGFKGVLGIPCRIALQIGFTGANIILSTVFSVLTPVWAPLSGLAMMGFDLAIYDTHAPLKNSPHITPFGQYVVGKMAFQGLLSTLYYGLKSVFYHPFTGTVKGIYGLWRAATHSLYDQVTFSVFKSLVSLPAGNSFAVEQIEGPGVNKEITYWVYPDVVLLGLISFLEEKELLIVKDRHRDEIERPLKRYTDFLHLFLSPFVSVKVDRTNNIVGLLATEEALYLRELEKKIWKRREDLHRLQAPSNLKMSSEDLELTLSASQTIVEDFFQNYLTTHYSKEEIQILWDLAKIKKGHYQALTHFYLSELFSPSLLTPLKEDDHSSFVIKVEDETMKRILSLEKSAPSI